MNKGLGFKRVLVMGDTHCGSVTGLTPPSWDQMPETGTSAFEVYELRRWLWENFSQAIENWSPFDLAIFNGDLIDGSQSKSSGWGLLTPDRLEQAQMAKQIVKKVGAATNRFTMGTAYHTGSQEDFEELIANDFDERIVQELVQDVEGTIIHARHHVSGSQLSHTRQNALGKEILDLHLRISTKKIDAEHVHVLVRSHCHYGGVLVDHGVTAIRVPALQLEGENKWARRFPSARLEYGLVILDVYGPGVFTHHLVTWDLPPRQAETLTSSLRKAETERREDSVKVLLKEKKKPTVPQGYVGSR